MRQFVLVSAAVLVSVFACGPGATDDIAAVPDGGMLPDGGAPSARNVGERCDDGGVCRSGLTCNAGVCQPSHAGEAGSACHLSAECKDALYCASGVCATAGVGEVGAACGSDAECKSGLRCNLVGLDAQCQPEGMVDLGGTCAASKDCFGGLLCADRVCVSPPPGGVPPLGIPGFKGVACEAETGDVTAHFSVPRGTGDKDFFRLPYPNDIRKKGAKLDLTGFPTPGSDLLGYDLVDRWARYLEETGDGYSVFPTVTFRFSGEIDFKSLEGAGTLGWIDLTTGKPVGYRYSTTTGRSNYVCPSSLRLRPRVGAPLLGGHIYAVLLSNATKTKDGKTVLASDDLRKVLAATAPADLGPAWTAYAPLRDWAGKNSFDLGTLVDAAVFTVGKSDAIARALPAAVAATPAPELTGAWVDCKTGPSPCAQATGARACPATPDPAFTEYHGVLKMPLFQKGTLPFVEPADGGGFVLDANGAPIAQGTIEVCAALTVPTGATAGTPIVVYAHGTGGSFRSHVTEGIAARMATRDAGGKKIAVLGFDQVGHGTRRGASTAAPETLFFNFGNPRAARDNVLQGAADVLTALRFAATTTAGAASFGTVAFWGHSQGATEGGIAVPYATGVAGTLFSGQGGGLVESLLTKKSPINLAALAPVILSELPGSIDDTHPALAMFQNAIDPADPLDHALAITSGLTRKHVFVPYGQLDTYATPITQLSYVHAAGLAVAPTPASVAMPDDLLTAPSKGPVSGNAGGFTAVVRQYPKPATSDGHFVVFKDATAVADADEFLAAVLAGTVPTVGD